MKNSGKPTVDLNEMIDAFDMNSDAFRSFVNKMSGQIVHLMDGDDFPDLEDEEAEDDFIPEYYVSLPGSWELNKYKIMEDFCSSVEDDEIQYNLLKAIRGNGAFGRFLTAIH